MAVAFFLASAVLPPRSLLAKGAERATKRLTSQEFLPMMRVRPPPSATGPACAL
jgi:hypothetical protein